MTEQDQWSKWLLETRFGGDAESMSRGMAQLYGVRDQVLKNATIQQGETVLDVGCGDGLIAFGALDRVGARGKVVFSDISPALLEHCRQIATRSGVLGRCSFVEASADELTPIPDASVDVVTTRSVLIYVRDKAAAFRAFQRVLRPGGRVSFFEPINRFGETYGQGDPWTHGIPEIADLGSRLRDYYAALQPLDSDPMMDFDQHGLVRFAELAGFKNIHLSYHVIVMPMPPANWDVLMNSPGNPNIPSVARATADIFSEDERARFEKHLRPVLEAGGRPSRSAVAYLTANKDG